jgi:hypothetical protein
MSSRRQSGGRDFALGGLGLLAALALMGWAVWKLAKAPAPNPSTRNPFG